jgi:hypothetical protein
MTWGLAFAAAAIVVTRQELRASGNIDTSGATFAPGAATSPGTVTIDTAADLGAVPPMNDVDVDVGIDDAAVADFQSQVFDMSQSGYAFGGLGGPNFHAHADVTLSAREQNFGSFTVDQGVTVTVAAGSTVHIAGAARIDGRVLLQGRVNSWASLDCGGDLDVVGHAGAVTGGIAAESTSRDDLTYNDVSLPGRLTVTADDGARVRFEGNIGIYGHVAATIAHADSQGLRLYTSAAVTFSDCVVQQIDVNGERDVALSVSGSSIDEANLFVGGATTLTDVTITRLGVNAPTGSLHVAGTSSVGVATSTTTGWFNVTAYGDILVDDGVACTATSFDAFSYHGRVLLGTGVQLDQRSTGGGGHSYIAPYGYGGVEIRGYLKSDDGVEANASHGDVVLGANAQLTTSGTVRLHAQGAVTASGGTATIACSDLDVRCVDGDLDLDVASVTVGDGQIVVISNGEVRLRGTFQSSHDVQILSRRDAIDVSGATIRTADAGAGLSGFVRLATYASTASIDASNSTLTTGSSDGQSGDILLQIAQTGGATQSGALRVVGVTTRDAAAGPVTLVKGVVRWKKRGVDFAGSNRVGAGALSQHVYLSGKKGRLTGSAGSVDLKVTRSSATSSTFVMTLRDGGGAAGEIVPVTLQRAGFHATGKFRRPKAKTR